MRRGYAVQNYNSTDLRDRTSERSPEELIALLFDTACASVKKGQNALAEGELQMFHDATGKAVQIVLGLREVLDMEHGGELADTYTSIAASLFKAKREKDDISLGKIYEALAELRGAWKTVSGPDS